MASVPVAAYRFRFRAAVALGAAAALVAWGAYAFLVGGWLAIPAILCDLAAGVVALRRRDA